MTIDPVRGWFEITHCDYKRVITIENLVENMWMTRYLWQKEITYDQV